MNEHTRLFKIALEYTWQNEKYNTRFLKKLVYYIYIYIIYISFIYTVEHIRAQELLTYLFTIKYKLGKCFGEHESKVIYKFIKISVRLFRFWTVVSNNITNINLICLHLDLYVYKYFLK